MKARHGAEGWKHDETSKDLLWYCGQFYLASRWGGMVARAPLSRFMSSSEVLQRLYSRSPSSWTEEALAVDRFTRRRWETARARTSVGTWEQHRVKLLGQRGKKMEKGIIIISYLKEEIG